jgi:hypothetical protein
MTLEGRDQLRDLLEQKVAAVSNLAVREQGNVPPDLIKDLSNFKQLVDLHQSVVPASSRKHWILPIVIVITVLVTSALLFLHLPYARVDLDITAGATAFILDESQDLISNVRVLSISAAGLRGIEASGFDLRDQSIGFNPGVADSMRLSLLGDKGEITLDNIHLPAKTRVTLEILDGSNRFRVAWKLSGKQAPTPLSISAIGDIQLGLSASAVQVLHLNTPKGLELVPGSEVALDLDLPKTSQLTTEPQLPASMLSFSTVHESVGEASSARQISTVRSGSVFIQSLNGQKYELRSGERLRFDNSRGDMQKILLGPSGITVQYEGEVWGMNAGSHEFPTSLMPSLLEWLRARHGLSLLWGSTLYLVGMLMVVLRWFRMID